MGYQIGVTAATMVDASTVFGNDPKSVWTPGGERARTVAGTDIYRGYPKSKWHFTTLTLAQYRKALLMLTGVSGSGTITASTAAVTGVATLFTTELSTGYLVGAHLGSGVYEVGTVAGIASTGAMTLSASPTTAYSGKAFRYRLPTTYSSSACFVQTRTDTDVYQVYSAICRFPEPESLERSGGKYINTILEFVLLAAA